MDALLAREHAATFAAELNGDPDMGAVRWESDELQNAAEAVKGLKAHPGYAVIDSLLRQREQTLLKRLVIGGPFEQADYARTLGVINGLRDCRTAVEAVLQAAELREQEEREAVEAAWED